MIDEPNEPDIDPGRRKLTDDEPDVEGHRRRPRTAAADDAEDAPDFEGHMRAAMPAAPQRRR